MALIKCPECGKDVSDKSVQCIHCGYPLLKKELRQKDEWTFNGVTKNISNIINMIGNNNKVAAIKSFRELFLCGLQEAYDEVDKIRLNKKNDTGLQLHCPKCKSTNVVTGQRGFSLMTGFLGSNKTVNRCANCGHKWEPGK